jgi:hypothetical protein
MALPGGMEVANWVIRRIKLSPCKNYPVPERNISTSSHAAVIRLMQNRNAGHEIFYGFAVAF